MADDHTTSCTDENTHRRQRSASCMVARLAVFIDGRPSSSCCRVTASPLTGLVNLRSGRLTNLFHHRRKSSWPDSWRNSRLDTLA
jgi:hypothetical protein